MKRYLAITLFTAACATEQTGTITATVYGEDFIEQGIPADAFNDGWSVQFDSFLVSIGNVAAKAGEGGREVGDPAFYIVDLAQPSGGEGYALATFDAPAGTYDHYGYALRPDGAATSINASAQDAAAMKAAGYSIWVRGRAEKAGVQKTFDWGFTVKLGHAHCEVSEAIDGNDVTIQSTIHADHFFYDDAVSEEPELSFQLLADADANSDGVLAQAELAAMDIRTQTRYQVGSNRDPRGAEITNMWQYLELQATTLGHINGEGHCEDLIVQP